MDPWGIAYNRKLTWAHESRGWNDYLARAQAVLQAGTPVVDLLQLVPEDAPNHIGIASFNRRLGDRLLNGMQLDSISAVALGLLSVDRGDLVTASGMRYHALVMPSTTRIAPPTLDVIARLADSGARLAGARPAVFLGDPAAAAAAGVGGGRTGLRLEE